MENSRIFWIFVLIGFLITIIFYLQNNARLVSSLKNKLNTPSNVVENFADSNKSSENASDTILTIPQEKNIGMYINSFLDLNGLSSTYLISGWLDTYNPNTIEFKYTNGVPPTALTTSGFPTKTIGLLGPSSENIADKNKILGSFTISFYMQINNNLQFPVDSNGSSIDIELLQIYMQTPYYVIFYLTPDPKVSTNININALVGNSVYTWNIALSALVTGNMYSFVIDTSTNANTPTITLYINTANINITSPPKINTPTTLYLQSLTLGVSQLLINKGGYLDANLWAFVYYNSILSSTDITALYNYFNQQKSGYANLQALLAKQAALNADAAKNTSNISSNLAVCNKLNAELKNKCTSNVVNTPPKPNWSINAGSASYSTLSDSDLEKCSPLIVKKFGESNTHVYNDTPGSPQKYLPNNLKIQYPSHSTNYTTPNTANTPAQAYESSSTPNYADPKSSSYDFGSITSSIFSFFNM